MILLKLPLNFLHNKKKQVKFLNILTKKQPKTNENSQQENDIQNVSAKITTYSHEYRALERTQIDLIKLHQQALQKRLQEHLELLNPDSEQPSTSTAQNLQSAQIRLAERNLKIAELQEKVKDLKNIKTEIDSINSVLSSIQPLKRETREESLNTETKIEVSILQLPQQQTPKPRKRLMKLKHLQS